jgi:hypothetical protein
VAHRCLRIIGGERTVPIVFANVVDPVGAGFVASLARPGGNVTGFSLYEFGFPIKWLELLKQIAPGITRAAVLRDPSISALIGQFAAIQGVAPSFGVELTPIDVRDADEIQRAVAGFVRGPADGLIVLGGPSAKPKWEFPRLCRGGSKSLTYPGVDAHRRDSKSRAAKHTKGSHRWMSMRGICHTKSWCK